MLTGLATYAAESIIREDRIWEFGPDPIIFPAGEIHGTTRYKFDGVEIKNGTEYHVLKVETEDGWQPVGLLRDEYSPLKDAFWVYLFLERPKIDIRTWIGQETYDIKELEIPIYIHERESYYRFFGIQEVVPMATGFTREDFENVSYLTILDCTEYGTLTFANDIPRYYYCLYSYQYEDRYPTSLDEINYPASYEQIIGEGMIIVEGVGNIGYGSPHCPAIPEYSEDENNPAPNRFYRQTDLDGNTIFDARWIFGSTETEPVAIGTYRTDNYKLDQLEE